MQQARVAARKAQANGGAALCVEEHEELKLLLSKSAVGMNEGKGMELPATSTVARSRSFLKVITGFGLITLAAYSPFASAQSQTGGSAQPTSLTGQPFEEDTLIRKLYGGVGLGMSMLEPDTSEVVGVDNKDGANAGAQFMVGLDINKWASIEGHFATLGKAALEPEGSLGYSTLGVSALAYAGRGRHNYNRRGFKGFGRLGYGFLRNTPSDGLRFKQVNSSHLLIGAGLEYALRDGIGFRAEAIAFDTDVRYAQLSVLYRIGRRTEKRRERIVEAPKPAPAPVAVAKPKPIPKPAPVVVPVPAVVVAKIDTDTDGVQDTIDRCPNTRQGVAVDNVGCDLFSGVIEGVNFNSGSADLTPSAQGILSGVVATLKRFPTVKLSIMAHTDSQGEADANKQLSRQRAKSVAIYLVRNGISAKRLKAYGFGEERPIDSNETSEGRLRNRRVEFLAAS